MERSVEHVDYVDTLPMHYGMFLETGSENKSCVLQFSLSFELLQSEMLHFAGAFVSFRHISS